MSVAYCRWTAAVVTIFLVVPPEGARAGFTIDAWDLACGITDANSGGGGVVFNVAENPFHASHQIVWAGATDSASYDISWDAQAFDFQMTTSVTAPGTNFSGFTSACTGGVRVTTDADLLLDVDSAVTFALPDGDREVNLSVTASIPGGAYLFSALSSSVPVFGDPRYGVLNAHGSSILLPSNGTYVINYGIDLYSTWPSNPAVLSHADGFVNLHLSVPEPATLAMLSIAALAFHRRLRLRRS